MNSVVKEIAGGKWWKVDFHVHTPASMDYGKGSMEPGKYGAREGKASYT